MLTQKRLKELLDYDPDTGIFTRRLNASSRARLGKKAGAINSGGYLQTRLERKMYLNAWLAWLYIYGRWPTKWMDHINGNRADNRLCNLREANETQNAHNAKKNNKNTSGFKGIGWDKRSGRWRARITINWKRIHLGRFEDKYQAAFEYDKAAIKYHGDYAKTNFPTRKDLDL